MNTKPLLTCCFSALLLLSSSAICHASASIPERLDIIGKQIQKHPDDAELYIQRGRVYRDAEQWDMALQNYAKAHEIAPDMYQVLFWQGDAWLNQGHYQQAQDAFQQYLSHKPNDSSVHIELARVFIHLGRYHEAAEHYDYVITNGANPVPQIYLDRARCLMKIKPQPVAEIQSGLQQGLNRYPNNVTILDEMIAFSLSINAYTDAITQLDLLPDQLQQQPKWLIKRADIEKLRGNRERAITLYQQALANLDSLPEKRQKAPAYRAARENAEQGLTALSLDNH